MERKRGQTVRSEARNIIGNLIKKLDEESVAGDLQHPLNQATRRAADYAGISERTVLRIRKEILTSGNQKLRSPGKKRPRTTGAIYQCTEVDQQIIRNTIYEYYAEKNVVPTVPKLLSTIRKKIEFPWTRTTLSKLLHRLGYKWKKSNNIRKVLIENPNIVTWRSKYLKAIDCYRNQGRNIIYIDETWVDNTSCLNKCLYCHKTTDIADIKNTSPSVRVVIIHAGGINGFIKNAALMYMTTVANYEEQMNSSSFEKWLTEKLIPNIPANSIIVMDNAPYHTVELNKPPSKYGSKEEMIKWLLGNNIVHSQDMRKFELYEIIKTNNKEEKTLKADQILKLHGHNVLRLPPYVNDLNPMELAWSKLKCKIREKNKSIVTNDELLQYVQEAIAEINQNDWEGFLNHVIKLEKEYWQKDGLMDEIIDKMDLNLQSDTSGSESDESSSSEDF